MTEKEARVDVSSSVITNSLFLCHCERSEAISAVGRRLPRLFASFLATPRKDGRGVIVSLLFFCHCEEPQATWQSHERGCGILLAMTGEQVIGEAG